MPCKQVTVYHIAEGFAKEKFRGLIAGATKGWHAAKSHSKIFTNSHQNLCESVFSLDLYEGPFPFGPTQNQQLLSSHLNYLT